MAWSAQGHIADLPAAYRAARSSYVGDIDLAMGTSDLTSVAVAEAAALANAANPVINHVSQTSFGPNVARGFRVASNLYGTFNSTFAVLQASLPTVSNGSKAMMISGS